jgi:N-hydroxyarylamine O-acetyltransferase
VLDIAGYLARLGRDRPDEPSLDALIDLHRAQVERVPYSTLDLHLGRPCPLDPVEAVRRIAATGRTGYCYNLNGAFAALLDSVGFEVRAHRGWVWAKPDDDRPFANHLALTVHGLATPDNPTGSWLVDAGLGDALHEPMPLRVGEVTQGPFSYQLEVAGEIAGWRFRHDRATGSFGGMDFEVAISPPSVFEVGHEHLSTSPDSPFLRNVIVQRRDGTGVDRLMNRTIRRVEGARTVKWEINTAVEWFAALADVFWLTLDDLDRADRELLWRRAVGGQRVAR